jgi:antitoxin HicB
VKRKVKEQKDIQYYMRLPYSILVHEIEDGGKKYWMAEFPELPGCVSHGLTVDEAVKNAEEAKKDWILDSLEEGDEVPAPIDRDRFSGKTLVRMSRSLHRALSLMAESENLSLNQLIVTMLAKEVGRLGVLNRVEEKLDNLLDRLNEGIEARESELILDANTAYSLFGRVCLENQWQVPVDTGIRFEAPSVVGNEASYVRPSTPAVAGTASPFEDLWHYPYYSHQKAGGYRIIFSEHKEKESEAEVTVELKEK